MFDSLFDLPLWITGSAIILLLVGFGLAGSLLAAFMGLVIFMVFVPNHSLARRPGPYQFIYDQLMKQ
jgi:hypothetical protein